MQSVELVIPHPTICRATAGFLDIFPHSLFKVPIPVDQISLYPEGWRNGLNGTVASRGIGLQQCSLQHNCDSGSQGCFCLGEPPAVRLVRLYEHKTA